MTEQPPQDEVNIWHRRFAVICNNSAWELTQKPERTTAEGRELLYLAYAAAYHWSKVGTALNHARAEVLLAHALSLSGDGELAMQYARSALAFFEAGNGEDWDLAFAHLEVSLAAATQGEDELHRLHYSLAHAQGEAIQDQEDRDIFFQELGRIPAT
jgi:hypothetical protein